MTILCKPNLTWLLIAVLFAGVMTTTTIAAAPKRPNVLYIMSDDHCAQAVGAYGGRLATLNPTPVIDQLAAEGMLFENCFCTNSICSPSRACVITGQYNHTNGAYDLGGSVPPENQTLAIEMREAGYETAMVGKWHLKVLPNFDYYKVLPGQGSYMNPTPSSITTAVRIPARTKRRPAGSFMTL
jgi:N-acetylglucosamine-6-sulfatase